MKEIRKILTFDGKEHANQTAANTHLDNLLGVIVDQYTTVIAAEPKRSQIALLLFAMLQDTAKKVAQIENDRTLFTEED